MGDFRRKFDRRPKSSDTPSPALVDSDPLGPLGFSQHSPATRSSVERTADKVFLLSDRVSSHGLKQVVDLLRLNLERDTSRRDALTDPGERDTDPPMFPARRDLFQMCYDFLRKLCTGNAQVRCRANMAHMRQSRPDSGLGSQVKFHKSF